MEEECRQECTLYGTYSIQIAAAIIITNAKHKIKYYFILPPDQIILRVSILTAIPRNNAMHSAMRGIYWYYYPDKHVQYLDRSSLYFRYGLEHSRLDAEGTIRSTPDFPVCRLSRYVGMLVILVLAVAKTYIFLGRTFLGRETKKVRSTKNVFVFV